MAKKNHKKKSQFHNPLMDNASKTLFANIRFVSIDEKVKTLVVTSSGVDEGKTQVSTNLAFAMASAGKKVLIVDTDMRRRCIAGLLGLHPENGLYAVLAGTASLQNAISATKIPNLYFMDSEPNIPSPPDILSTKRFAALVDKLRELFDYVVFDTPPIGMFVDAAIISNLVDGTLFVVRERSAKRDAVLAGVQQLKAANARILGTVMTFSQEESNNDYYYAYYNEQGKRVSKKDREAAAAQNAAAPSTREIAADDIDQWARKAGLDPARAQRAGAEAVRRQRVASQQAARTGVPSAVDQFPTGAFRPVQTNRTPRHKNTRI